MYAIKVYPIAYPKFNSDIKDNKVEYIKQKKEESKEFKKVLEKYSQNKHSLLDIRV